MTKWNIEEINYIKKNYPNLSKEELINNLRRSWCSVKHKSLKLGLRRNPKFIEEGNKKGRDYFKYNNPMNNPIIKRKIEIIIKEQYSSGGRKITGIAKLSAEGLTKKENHPNWLGGISFEPYDILFDDSFKYRIRKRDNFQCKLCRRFSKVLCIHHIDYNKKNTSSGNCISLCISCHTKTNYNREYWKKLFLNKILEIKNG